MRRQHPPCPSNRQPPTAGAAQRPCAYEPIFSSLPCSASTAKRRDLRRLEVRRNVSDSGVWLPFTNRS
jgi:hypothetical protein